MSNRIRELRKEKGLSQKEFAKAFNEFNQNDENVKSVSYATISRWENGENEPKLGTWYELANFFNVPIPYIQGVSDSRKLKESKTFSEIAKKRDLTPQKMANIINDNRELFNWIKNLKNNADSEEVPYIKALKDLPEEYQEAFSAILLLVAYSNEHSGEYKDVLNIILKKIIKLNNPEERKSD